MPVFLEKYLLPVTATLTVLVLFTNPMNFDLTQRITGGLAICFVAYFIAHTLHNRNEPAKPKPTAYLTEFQTTRLTTLLSRHAGQKVIIVASVGQETLKYAKELQSVFVAAAWKPEGSILQAPQGELSMDLQVSSSNEVPPRSTVAQDLVGAFRFVEVKCRSTVIFDPDVGRDQVVVWVGPQSPQGVSPDTYPPQSTHLRNLKPFSQ